LAAGEFPEVGAWLRPVAARLEEARLAGTNLRVGAQLQVAGTSRQEAGMHRAVEAVRQREAVSKLEGLF
jgi:hypothetical protein